MNEEINFYSILAKVLLTFNFLSLFFTFTMLLFYAFLEYVGLEFIHVAETLFNSDSYWFAAVISLFELLLEIPGGLDTLFMAIIVVSIMNIFWVAYKSQKGGWLGFFFFISIGLPIWLWIASQIVDLRDTLLNYLNSTLVVKPDTIFFDYFTMYSLEISAFIFLTGLIIHMIDWENVREKIQSTVQKESTTTETIGERFEQ